MTFVILCVKAPCKSKKPKQPVKNLEFNLRLSLLLLSPCIIGYATGRNYSLVNTNSIVASKY